MKKILSIVLVLAMVMGLCVMASAATVMTADFDTLTPNTSYGTAKTATGWEVKNAAIFKDKTVTKGAMCVAINGKTSGVGSITSPVLQGGVSVVSFKYAYIFSESGKVDVTVKITAGGQTYTKDLKAEGVAKDTEYTFTWTLDTAVEGDFTLSITNNCPSKSSSNKDRLAIWNLSWTAAETGHKCEWSKTASSVVSAGHDKHAISYPCTAADCELVNTVTEDHDLDSKGACKVCDYVKPAKLNPHAVVTAPAAGTAYNLWMYQEHLDVNDLLYLDGKLDSQGFYLNTSDDHTKAVVIYVDVVEGGYHVYKMDGEKKVYMNIYLTDTNYVNCKWGDTPTLFTWDSKHNTFVTAAAVKGEAKYFAGTRNDRTFTTASACETKYIETNFKLHLSTVADVEAYYAQPVVPNVPEDGDFSAVVVALLAVSAMGITVLAKKKEF